MRDRDVDAGRLLLAEDRVVGAVDLRHEALDVRRIVLDAGVLDVVRQHQVVRQERLLSALRLEALLDALDGPHAVERGELIERQDGALRDGRVGRIAEREEALLPRRRTEEDGVREKPGRVGASVQHRHHVGVGVGLAVAGAPGLRRVRRDAREAGQRADDLGAQEKRAQVGDRLLLGLGVVVVLVAVDAHRETFGDRVAVDGRSGDLDALEVRADRAHVLVVLGGRERLGVVHGLEGEALADGDGRAGEVLEELLENAVRAGPADGVLREGLREELVADRALVGEVDLAGLHRGGRGKDAEGIVVFHDVLTFLPFIRRF